MHRGNCISMDGRGRCHDKIFVERLWWTVKREWVYLRPCENGVEQKKSLAARFDWYNRHRPHQSLSWQTLDQTYMAQRFACEPVGLARGVCGKVFKILNYKENLREHLWIWPRFSKVSCIAKPGSTASEAISHLQTIPAELQKFECGITNRRHPVMW